MPYGPTRIPSLFVSLSHCSSAECSLYDQTAHRGSILLPEISLENSFLLLPPFATVPQQSIPRPLSRFVGTDHFSILKRIGNALSFFLLVSNSYIPVLRALLSDRLHELKLLSLIMTDQPARVEMPFLNSGVGTTSQPAQGTTRTSKDLRTPSVSGAVQKTKGSKRKRSFASPNVQPYTPQRQVILSSTTPVEQTHPSSRKTIRLGSPIRFQSNRDKSPKALSTIGSLDSDVAIAEDPVSSAATLTAIMQSDHTSPNLALWNSASSPLPDLDFDFSEFMKDTTETADNQDHQIKRPSPTSPTPARDPIAIDCGPMTCYMSLRPNDNPNEGQETTYSMKLVMGNQTLIVRSAADIRLQTRFS